MVFLADLGLMQRAKVADHKRQSVEQHLVMAGKTVEQQATVLQQQATLQAKTIATLQQQEKVIASLQLEATLVKQLVAHLKPGSLAKSRHPPSFSSLLLPSS